MIALDTNVLVRYIMQDHAKQAQAASKVIESLTPKGPAFISHIVLCELNWVLKSAYKISKKDRIRTLSDVLSLAVFDIERVDHAIAALKKYQNGKADFSDYMIFMLAQQRGCEKVLTFDKAALQDKVFQAP